MNELEAVWGGETGADHLTHHLKPTIITLYVPTERAPRTVTKLVARHRLRADANGDIELLDMFWDFPADPATPDVAPPILVYADLAANSRPP